MLNHYITTKDVALQKIEAESSVSWEPTYAKDSASMSDLIVSYTVPKEDAPEPDESRT